MQQTLAQLVRAKFPGAYDDLSDQQLESSVRSKYPGVYDDLPLSGAKPEKPKDRQSGLATIGDFIVGTLKSGGEQAINLGRMLRSIPGADAVLAGGLRSIPGVGDALAESADAPVQAFDAARTYMEPTNTAQRVGKVTGDVASIILPASKVSAAARGLSLGARMLVEGAAGAGYNAVQGASPTAGAVVGAAIPGAGAAVRGAKSLLRGAGASPVVRDAVAWGVGRGIPVDAATASGAPIVRAIQGAADATPLGGVIASQARNQADSALTATGRGLAGAVHPDPATMVSAGEAIQGRLGEVVKQASAQADDAYGRLRAIEAGSGAPKKLTTIPTDVAPTITDVTPSRPGTPFAKLAPEEQAAIRSLQAEISASPFERGAVLQGEEAGGRAGLVDSSGSRQAYQNQRGSNLLRNSPNASAFRDIGGASGVQVDARLQSYISGGNPTAVTDRALRVAQRMLGLVDDAATENPLSRQTGSALSAVASPAEYSAMQGGTTDVLRAVKNELVRHGIKPGSEQYQAVHAQLPDLLDVVKGMRESGASAADVSAAVANGVKELIDFQAPSLAMVVDLAPARVRLAPVYHRMMRAAQIAQPMGAEARALQAMDRLMNAEGQHAPLSVVDDALSDLKGVLRSAPDKLGKGAGALSSVVSSLDAQVQAAARRAGPEAVQALQQGRAATVQKYVAADLAERLGAEPARVTGRVTARDDTSVRLLRDLSNVAPAELPKVGRAVIDDLIETATAEGGFGRTAGVFQKWQGLGEETKALLFKPDVRQDLDRFFLLAKRMGESPNPSMSGTIAMTGGSTALVFTNPATGVPLVLGAGALSKLLHSPTGARMVTQLMSTPRTAANYPGLLSTVSRVAGLTASQQVGR